MAGIEKSMIRAPLWQVAEKGKPASLKILNVQNLLGSRAYQEPCGPPSCWRYW